MRFTYLFLINILIGSTCLAQGPTTLTRAINLTTVTSSGVLSDTTATLIIDGTNIGTRGISLTNLGAAMLSVADLNSYLVTSLTVKGSGLSISGTYGALTLTSTLTSGNGISVSSGTISLSNVISSTTGSLTTGTITSLFSTTGIISTGTINVATITTANIGTINATSASSFSAAYFSGAVRVDTSAINLANTTQILWKDGANANSGSPYAGITSLTTNVLRVTNGSTGTGAFQTGGFFPGFVAATANTSLTIANAVVTASAATVITTTLPDGTTGPAGRLIMITNLGGTNVTVTSFNSSQNIDGAASVTLSSGSGGHFIYNGTTWNRLKAQ